MDGRHSEEAPSREEDIFRSTMRIDLTPELLKKLGVSQEQATRSIRRRPRVVSSRAREGRRGKGSRFHELLDSVYDGVLICELSGRVVEANARASELFLYEREELRGRNVTSLLAGAEESLLDAVREALRGERFVVIQAYCERKDGSYFPAEIAVNLLRVGDEQLCFFVRDVTVRKETEDRLRAVTIAVENAASGIVITDLEGRISYANPAAARMSEHVGSDELTGEPVSMLFEDPATTDRIAGEILHGKGFWQGEAALRREGGRSLAVEVTAAANRDSDGELIGMVFSLMDITDRKRIEEALREAAAQRAMIASIGAACHHLGQPATVLVTNLELLKRYYDRVPSEVRDLLVGCLEAAESFGDILRRLNAATSFETEKYIRSRTSDPARNEILKI